MRRTVTLMDEAGTPLGEADIVDAHTGEGKMHRAFSVYVFTPDLSEILIQKRAATKMLWANFWANTCCSHPFPNEDATSAGKRRLHEELGFTCELQPGETFTYRAEDPTGKGVEHEHVTILAGLADPSVTVVPNPDEVSAWKWIAMEVLKREMKEMPDHFAPWFHIGLPKAIASLHD